MYQKSIDLATCIHTVYRMLIKLKRFFCPPTFLRNLFYNKFDLIVFERLIMVLVGKKSREKQVYCDNALMLFLCHKNDEKIRPLSRGQKWSSLICQQHPICLCLLHKKENIKKDSNTTNHIGLPLLSNFQNDFKQYWLCNLAEGF